VLTPTATISDIRRKVEARDRISSDEALWLWREASDDDMRSLASQVRARC
jgi:cyclic dehypoxanthinyl futalosine synthase